MVLPRRAARRLAAALAAILAALAPAAGRANAVLDRMIVEFTADAVPREDLMVENAGTERLYLELDTVRVRDPGHPTERREPGKDPDQLGLLVTPTRLVLEPGQFRLIRVALLDTPAETDEVWRIGVKPVVGETKSDRTAVKVMIGYEVLVIARPKEPRVALDAKRTGRVLDVRNTGNTNVLLQNGRQCDDHGRNCVALPAKRVHAGASWRLQLPRDAPVTYEERAIGEPTVHVF